MTCLKRISGTVLLAAAAINGAAALNPVPTAETDSTATALAVFVGGVVNDSFANFARMGLDVNREAFVSELMRMISGEQLAMTSAEADAFLNRRFEELHNQTQQIPAADPAEEAAFLSAAAARHGAVTTPSGLVFETIAEGTGTHPDSTMTASLRYRGTLSDGSVFDEITTDEDPVDFLVRDLTPGFTEGLQMMRPGGRYRITMPATLAYGNEGIPGIIPPGAALCFEVELTAVKK